MTGWKKKSNLGRCAEFSSLALLWPLLTLSSFTMPARRTTTPSNPDTSSEIESVVGHVDEGPDQDEGEDEVYCIYHYQVILASAFNLFFPALLYRC